MAARNHTNTKRLRNLMVRRPVEVSGFDDSVELFEGLDRRQLEEIGGHFTVTVVDTGTKLGRQGVLCQSFVVVMDGQVGVSADGLPIGVLSSGSFFGELPLLGEMGDQRYRTDLTTLTESRIAVADPRQFSAIMRDFDVVADRLRAMAASRRTFMEKVAEEHASGVEALDEAYPTHVPHHA